MKGKWKSALKRTKDDEKNKGKAGKVIMWIVDVLIINFNFDYVESPRKHELTIIELTLQGSIASTSRKFEKRAIGCSLGTNSNL